MSTEKAHPEINGQNLHDEYDVHNAINAKQAIEEEIRPALEDWVLNHTGGDLEEHRVMLVRLYAEWALEHAEDLNHFGNKSMMHDHPYALEAERHLRDIVGHLD